MELAMTNGFRELNEQCMMEVDGGDFLEGLVHVGEGIVSTAGGAGLLHVASTMTTTKVIPALLMVGTGAAGVTAAVCGIAVIGIGIYEMIF